VNLFENLFKLEENENYSKGQQVTVQVDTYNTSTGTITNIRPDGIYEITNKQNGNVYIVGSDKIMDVTNEDIENDSIITETEETDQEFDERVNSPSFRAERYSNDINDLLETLYKEFRNEENNPGYVEFYKAIFNFIDTGWSKYITPYTD